MSVSGAITDVDTMGTYVDLRLSSPYLDNGTFTGIDGATVTLFDGDSTLGELNEVSSAVVKT